MLNVDLHWTGYKRDCSVYTITAGHVGRRLRSGPFEQKTHRWSGKKQQCVMIGLLVMRSIDGRIWLAFDLSLLKTTRERRRGNHDLLKL